VKSQYSHRTSHFRRKERAIISVATKSSGKKERTRTKITPRGPKGPKKPRNIMRDPQQPQQHKATPGEGQKKGSNDPRGAPIDPSTATSHQQLHTTIDTILHIYIAPPDASDVRKTKNALQLNEPDHIPTRTNRKDPTSKQKVRADDELQKRLPPSTKLATLSLKATGTGSDKHQHAEQSPALIGDRVSRTRKRQHSLGEPLPGPHPHTISRLSELLDTCTDA
jgi:hypothetical protein